MAKMFYSLEEVMEKTGLNEDQIKSLVTEGDLREFRDGSKRMFKVDDVDSLDLATLEITPAASPAAPQESHDDKVDASSESGEIGLQPLGSSIGEVRLDDHPGMDVDLDGTDMDLEAPDLDAPPEEAGVADTGAGGSDFGLASMDSGSQIGLIPDDSSADQIDVGQEETSDGKDDTVVTGHGVEVLDDDEAELADPLAQTQMAPDISDQVNLDSGSSGSGLLDLTREADDTSLGAELLDEIFPGGGEERSESQVPTQLDMGIESTAGTEAGSEAAAETLAAPTPSIPEFAAGPTVAAAGPIDPVSGVYGVAMIIPFLVLVYLAFVAGGAVLDLRPALMTTLQGIIWYVVGGAALVTVLVAFIGSAVIGGASQPRTAKAPKAKAPKAKAPKKEKPKKTKKK